MNKIDRKLTILYRTNNYIYFERLKKNEMGRSQLINERKKTRPSLEVKLERSGCDLKL